MLVLRLHSDSTRIAAIPQPPSRALRRCEFCAIPGACSQRRKTSDTNAQPIRVAGLGPTSQLKIDTMSNNRPWTKEDVKSRILNTVCPETHLPPIPEHNLALPSGHACPAPAFRLHAHRCNTSTAIQSTATVRILCNPRGLQSTAKNKI